MGKQVLMLQDAILTLIHVRHLFVVHSSWVYQEILIASLTKILILYYFQLLLHVSWMALDPIIFINLF